MKAYCIDHFGSVDGVLLQSRADPQPGRREILVRVRATSLNYRDLMVLKGGGRGPTKVGVVPLSDGAGEVVALGDGVTRFAVGDRVIGCFHPRWFGGPIKADYLTDRLGANLDGMLAEYAVVSEEAAVPVPDDLSFEEAATLPCAAVTGWVALTRLQRGVTAGDTVLTQGTGGVSIFALQFARLLGAQVIATTSSAEKAERLKALGAAAVINYVETPDWHEEIFKLTGGTGVDCVVEIGGPGTLTNSIKALAVGGHISLIGSSLSRSGIMLDPLLLGGRGMSLGSISVGSRADFEAMNRAIALHRLRPVIDRVKLLRLRRLQAERRRDQSGGQLRLLQPELHRRARLFARRRVACGDQYRRACRRRSGLSRATRATRTAAGAAPSCIRLVADRRLG